MRTRIIERMRGGHTIKAHLFSDRVLTIVSEHNGKLDVAISIRRPAVEKLLRLLAASPGRVRGEGGRL